jgi:hypothetical protein
VADDKHEFWFANVNILNYTIILITPYLLWLSTKELPGHVWLIVVHFLTVVSKRLLLLKASNDKLKASVAFNNSYNIKKNFFN